ncbi:MAG: hypothetical protein JXC33_09205 [Deltaproteobacteria bacterium]|nr:hypothetical protein [Deltaproteobacteria bacterium]
MKQLHCAVIVLIIISLCSGCALFGKNKEFQPFDVSALNNIASGKSTATDITALFGAPTEVVKMSNGNAYIYKRSISKGTGIWLVLISFGNFERQHDQIVFFFNDRDILTHYGKSLNAEKASYGFPF